MVANVVMKQTRFDYPGVQELAAEFGRDFLIDPTITPHINGDRSMLEAQTSGRRAERNNERQDNRRGGSQLCGRSRRRGRPPDEFPCSAGHSSCYVSPYGDVYPCVQFPLPAAISASSGSSTSGNILRS